MECACHPLLAQPRCTPVGVFTRVDGDLYQDEAVMSWIVGLELDIVELANLI